MESIFDSYIDTLYLFRTPEYWNYAFGFTDTVFNGLIYNNIDIDNIKKMSHNIIVLFSAIDTLYENVKTEEDATQLSQILLSAVTGNSFKYQFKDRMFSDNVRIVKEALFIMMDILHLRNEVYDKMFNKYIYHQELSSKTKLSDIMPKHDSYIDALKDYLDKYSSTLNLNMLILSMINYLDIDISLTSKDIDAYLEPLLRFAADFKYDDTEIMSSQIYIVSSIWGLTIQQSKELLKSGELNLNLEVLFDKIYNETKKNCKCIFKDNCLRIAIKLKKGNYKLPILTNFLKELSLCKIKKNETSVSIYDTCFLYLNSSTSSSDKAKIKNMIKYRQIEDGSWGCTYIKNYCDRIVNTLSVILAFQDDSDMKKGISKGISYVTNTLKKLKSTDRLLIGFEIIVSSLIKQINKKTPGLISIHLDPDVDLSFKQKEEFLKRKDVSSSAISYYLEAIGEDVQIDYKTTLMMTSPASILSYLDKPGTDKGKLKSLFIKYKEEYDVSFSTLTSIDIFEFTWSVKYLSMLDMNILRNEHSCYLVDILEDEFNKGRARAYSTLCSLYESDCTSMVLNTLLLYGKKPNILDTLGPYYNGKYFKTFMIENVKSISANAHILEVLSKVDKCEVATNWEFSIIDFLLSEQTEDGYWKDKWHISPLYATCEVISSLVFYKDNARVNNSLKKAIFWIVSNQNHDGGWTECGAYLSTIEETCYALISIYLYNKYCDKINNYDNIKSNGLSLINSRNAQREALECNLWISKVLYSPSNLIVLLSIVVNILLK